jgi:hypothetical protein
VDAALLLHQLTAAALDRMRVSLPLEPHSQHISFRSHRSPLIVWLLLELDYCCI